MAKPLIVAEQIGSARMLRRNIARSHLRVTGDLLAQICSAVAAISWAA
jgi:SLT domain-containing protein